MPGLLTHTEARRLLAGFLWPKNLPKKWFLLGLDLLFPPRCAGCGRVDVSWCSVCAFALASVPLTLSLRNLDDNIAVVSTGVHIDWLQRAVQALKYEQLTLLQVPLGARLIDGLNQLDWPVDLIVPVPLSQERLRTRGYNQAQLLAEEVAAAHGIPHVPAAIQRVRYTHSQVGLNLAERRANVKDAFVADAGIVAGKTVLLIDDVCTTGSTLSACAQAALQAGARKVYGLTVTTPHPQALLPNLLSL